MDEESLSGALDIPAAADLGNETVDAIASIPSSIGDAISGLFNTDNTEGSSKKMADSSMDGTSLTAALAGDATTIAGAFIAADAAKNVVKHNPNSATTLIIVVGSVAALIAIVFVVKK